MSPLHQISEFEPCQHDTWTLGCKGCIRRATDRIAELEAENERYFHAATQPDPTQDLKDPKGGDAQRLKPSELAQALGIQLWTPEYTKGKGVGMKQTDDGSWIHLGDLPRASQPSSISVGDLKDKLLGEESISAAFVALKGCEPIYEQDAEAALEAALAKATEQGSECEESELAELREASDPCWKCGDEKFIWTGTPGIIGSLRIPCPECGRVGCPWHMPEIDALRAAAEEVELDGIDLVGWGRAALGSRTERLGDPSPAPPSR